MKRNKNFGSYRLHNFGTPKVLRMDEQTDGRSGPTSRPTFAKGTQVKMKKKAARWEMIDVSVMLK